MNKRQVLYAGAGAGMQEAAQSPMFDEIDGDTLEAVLDFIYTGSCSVHPSIERLELLLRAADYLQMDGLRVKASEYMTEHMQVRAASPSTCLSTLSLADSRLESEVHELVRAAYEPVRAKAGGTASPAARHLPSVSPPAASSARARARPLCSGPVARF